MYRRYPTFNTLRLTTHQNPLPRLLEGWTLVNGYYWHTPDDCPTGEAIASGDIEPLWRAGWLKQVSGRITLNYLGRELGLKGITPKR